MNKLKEALKKIRLMTYYKSVNNANRQEHIVPSVYEISQQALSEYKEDEVESGHIMQMVESLQGDWAKVELQQESNGVEEMALKYTDRALTTSKPIRKIVQNAFISGYQANNHLDQLEEWVKSSPTVFYNALLTKITEIKNK